jgi:hypothetical protein
MLDKLTTWLDVFMIAIAIFLFFLLVGIAILLVLAVPQ